MRSRQLGVSFGLVVVLGLGGVTSTAHAAPTIDKPAFTATPAELLAEAKAVKSSEDIAVLRDEHDISFDERGRVTETTRMVFIVLTPAGVDDWENVYTSYLPAYQEKPKVRARVIDSNGRVVELDQASITDQPSSESPQAAATDRRDINAPLPRLKAGSVVEHQIITVDREPFVGGGVAHVTDVRSGRTTTNMRVRYSSPAATKLRIAAFGLPASVKPKTETVGGRHVITYSIGSLPAPDNYEPYLWGDARPFPYIVASPIASWSSIAREYRAIVDKRIGEGAVALPTELPRTATIETARAVLAWMHRQVKYQGDGFDDAAVVPATPAELIKRGSGSSRDMATLLVALLRQTGIRAELALISSGYGPDIDKDVPGANRFTHVIVRAQIGKTDVWIDATQQLTAPGQLPWYAQGRLALVIADDTKALLTTPASTSTNNTIREIRTFELAETGGAKVSEVSREGGVFEAEQREWIRDTGADAVRKHLTQYAENEYRATFDSYRSTPPDDLSKPFEVTMAARESARAYSDREGIDVYLFPSDLFKKLPPMFTSPRDDAPPRKHDFKLPSPHIYEIENRLVVPTGYTMPTPAADKTRDLGAFKLVEKQRIDGQTFVITFRLDTGNPRIAPAAFTKTIDAVSDLRRQDAVHIVIPQSAHAIADKGNFRDAIAEQNKLIKLHPKEALHHQQLAHVLLKAGAGDAARREARKAVELEPNNADAHVVLAWVLQNDTFGRWLGFDHDRAGARAALEKARKLDPKHVGAATNLAELLERSPQGRRFDAGSDVRGAIAAWRAARTLDNTTEHTYALATALLWAGEGAEAEKLLRALPVAERRDQLLITAVALSTNAAAAVRTAGTLATGATKTKYIAGAAGLLMLMRRYDEMRAVLAEAKQTLGNGDQAEVFARLRRHDQPFKPTKDPKDAALEMALSALHPERVTTLFWDKTVREEVQAQESKLAAILGKNELMTLGLLEDILRSLMQTTVESGDGLWRLDVDINHKKSQMYLASDRGTPKLIGTSDALAGVGRHLLRLLARNDEKAALRLLDWLGKDLAARGNKEMLNVVWGANLPRGRKDMELAAAVLSGLTDATRAIPILAQCKPSTTDGQLACDWLLSDIYRNTEKWAELEEHARAWQARAPKQIQHPTNAQAFGLAHLGRFDDADRVIEAALAKDPDNRMLLFMYAEIAVARGQLGDAIRRLDPLAKQSSPQSTELNNVAWLKLADASDVKGAVMIARKAVALASKEPHALNTLAAIEAELGELGDAKQHLDSSVEANDEPKPGDPDLFVHGRILEQLGYVDDAIATYRQLKPGKRHGFTPDSDELAARRLKLLGVKKAK